MSQLSIPPGLSAYHSICSRILLLIMLLLPAVFAQAKWYEASSDHFVIYADESPKQIKKFAERLERFHDAMNYYYGLEDIVPSPSNRLTIYVTGSKSTMKTMHGGKSRGLAGFYRPMAGHPMAVVSKIINAKNATQGGFVLYHEYAHHYQYMLDSYAYPRWLREGFAEFFAGVKFDPNGDVGIGIAAQHRIYELLYGKKVPIHLLLNTIAYEEKKQKWKNTTDNFYLRSWGLFHMLQFSKERSGQFGAYIKALKQGEEEMAAAEQAFGDLEQLEKDLNSYLKSKKIRYLPVRAKHLAPGAITLRKFSKAEAAVMKTRLHVIAGTSKSSAQKLLDELMPLIDKFPDEFILWLTLAELALRLEQSEQAMTWVERALAINKDSIEAQLVKGFALEQMVQQQVNSEIGWPEVRKQFIKANRLEPDHPVPLIKFYDVVKAEFDKPTANSVAGLSRALQLAPYDNRLRLTLAKQKMQDKAFEEAIKILSPLANHPHSPKLSAQAREMIIQIGMLKIQHQQALEKNAGQSSL